jgi:regulator of replication initiation timing
MKRQRVRPITAVIIVIMPTFLSLVIFNIISRENFFVATAWPMIQHQHQYQHQPPLPLQHWKYTISCTPSYTHQRSIHHSHMSIALRLMRQEGGSNQDFDIPPTKNDNNNSTNDSIIDLSIIEQHVLASAQSQIDTQRILQALSADEPTARIRIPVSSFTSSNQKQQVEPYGIRRATSSQIQQRQPQQQQQQQQQYTEDLLYETETQYHQRPMTRYQISIAAAIACGTMVIVIGHNTWIALLVSISVFTTALFDDTDMTRKEYEEQSLRGAIARMIGRSTIRSVQASQPKLKAIARVMLTDTTQEVQSLRDTIQFLQEENTQLRNDNTQLRQQQAVQQQVYELLPNYTLSNLRVLAKQHQLSVSGSKVDVLQRLIQAKIIHVE